jgi:uncharacterized membrane protein
MEEPILDPHARLVPRFENLVAGRGMLAAGCILVLLGISFFLKLAIDNGWLPEIERVLLGLGLGTALVAAGTRRTNASFVVFAEAIIGLGASIDYLAIWASYGAFHLVPNGAAFLGLIAVTSALGVLAVVRRSARLAYFGLVGGLVTPLLVVAHTPAHVPLAIYLLVLAAAASALAPRVRYLDAAAFAGIALYAPAFFPNASATWLPWQGASVAAAFFFTFTAAIAIAACRAHTVVARQLVVSALAIALFACNLAVAFASDHRALGWALLALAAVLAGSLAFARLPQALRVVYAWGSLATLTFGLLALAHGTTLSALLALEAGAIAALGARLGVLPLRMIGYPLLALAGAAAVVDAAMHAGPPVAPFLNGYALAIVATCLGLGAAIRAARRLADGSERRVLTRVGPPVLNACALFAASLECARLFGAPAIDGNAWNGLASTALSILWGAFAAGCITVGVRTRDGVARWTGIALFAATVVKVFAVDLGGVDLVHRIVSFTFVGVLLVAASALYQRAVARTEAQA